MKGFETQNFQNALIEQKFDLKYSCDILSIIKQNAMVYNVIKGS